jgi:4-amino-4-deoxy-L-arabinose transferase-like glycosyltransferase
MRWRPSTALLLILGLALIARIVVVVATPHFVPIFDARDFHRHATSLANGHGYPPTELPGHGASAFRPPLYPLALAAVQVVGGWLTAERLLGALLGVVTVLLVFELSRRIWGERVAVVAGVIAAVFPPLVFLNASLLSEVLFIPLVLAAPLAVLEFRKDGRLRWALLAGVLCGLATLTRGNGALLLLAVCAGVWIKRPRFGRAALAAPLATLLAALVVVTPWAVRNTIVFHRFVGLSTETGFALAGTYNPESRQQARHPGEPHSPDKLAIFKPVFRRPGLDEAARVGLLNHEAVTYMGAHPGYVLETTAWNVLRVFDIERPALSFKLEYEGLQLEALGVDRLATPLVLVSGYVLLALAVLGAVAQARWFRARRAPAFVWAVPVLMVLPALVVYGLARYRAPLDPFLVMLAALAIVGAFDRRRARRGLSPEAPP